MGQVLHGSATTAEAVRRAIQNSQESLRALAKRYGLNPKTVAILKLAALCLSRHEQVVIVSARVGQSNEVARRLTEAGVPIARIDSGDGPTKVRPWSAQISAKRSFSARKP